MTSGKVIPKTVCLVILVMLLVGCGISQATPTSLPETMILPEPTANQVEPTATEPPPQPTPTNGVNGAGVVTGQLAFISGEKPLEGMVITLRGFDNMQETISMSTTIQSDGSFSFTNVDMPLGRVFVSSTEFEGVTYGSDIAMVEDETASLELPIPIFESTDDTSALSADRTHIFFEYLEPDTLRVVVIYIISNPSDRTVVAAIEGEPTIEFKIPEGATNLQLEDGVLGGRYVLTTEGFGDTAAIRPGAGQHQITFGYDVPYDGKVEISQSVNLPTNAVVILIPKDGLKIRGEQLEYTGPSDVQGITYEMYTGDRIEDGTDLAITVSGRPGGGGISLESESSTRQTSEPTEMPTNESKGTPEATAAPTPTLVPTETPLPIQFNFTPYENNPILNRGASGEWDYYRLWTGNVVYVDDVFHMFYTGIDEGGITGIGYAVSINGLTYTKYGANPIFQPDGEGFDATVVGYATPLVVGDTWMLFYNASAVGEPVSHFWRGGSSIGLTTAPGPTGPWTQGQLVLRADSWRGWDGWYVTPSSVIATEDGFIMYYSGAPDPKGGFACGMATSTDGINWTKYDDPNTTDWLYAESDPVMYPSDNGFGSSAIYCNVLKTDNGWEMFYEGWGGQGLGKIGYASSEDGINWSKRKITPIIPFNLGFPSAVKVGSTYYLYGYHWDTYALRVATGTITQP